MCIVYFLVLFRLSHLVGYAPLSSTMEGCPRIKYVYVLKYALAYSSLVACNLQYSPTLHILKM